LGSLPKSWFNKPIHEEYVKPEHRHSSEFNTPLLSLYLELGNGDVVFQKSVPAFYMSKPQKPSSMLVYTKECKS
jgi:hypothetical protein